MIGVANFHGIGIIRGMFTYIDPTVRERLVEQGTLFQIDRDGCRVGAGQSLPPGSHSKSWAKNTAGHSNTRTKKTNVLFMVLSLSEIPDCQLLTPDF